MSPSYSPKIHTNRYETTSHTLTKGKFASKWLVTSAKYAGLLRHSSTLGWSVATSTHRGSPKNNDSLNERYVHQFSLWTTERLKHIINTRELLKKVFHTPAGQYAVRSHLITIPN
jgi:hypothetical protein